MLGGVVLGGDVGSAAGSEFWQAGALARTTTARSFRKPICVFIERIASNQRNRGPKMGSLK